MPRHANLFSGMLSNIKPIIIDMPMRSFVLDRKGAFTVTLVDGEVWQQLDEDQVYHPADWRQPAADMRVTISPDAMHTFIMQVSGISRIHKVRRIH